MGTIFSRGSGRWLIATVLLGVGAGAIRMGGSVAAVALPPTWTTLTSSLNPSSSGQSVTFTATVKGIGGGGPTGSVTVMDGSVSLGTVALDGSGQGTLTTAALAIGTHPLRAVYSGDAGFATSTSDVLSQAVPQTTTCGNVGFFQPVGSPIFYPSHFSQFSPSLVLVADFNLDGKLDLAGFSDQITMMLGDGAGGFAFRDNGGSTEIAMNPKSITAGDFNLDGKPDIALAGRVFLGDGTGRFGISSSTAVRALGIPSTNYGLVVTADFNLDGKPDLALTKTSSMGTVTTLLGDGTGTFGTANGTQTALGSNASALAVGDFNLDGKPDLVATVPGLNAVALLLGDGAGGFVAASGSPLTVGLLPSWVSVGDFNRDGRPDLAVANTQSNSVSLLLGDGGGGFSQPAGSPLSVGAAPGSLSVGDFNLDGKPDLAVSNYLALNGASKTVSLLLGDGSGAFIEASVSPLSDDPSLGPFLASGDFNRDGRLDLVSVYAGTILLTHCDAAPAAITVSASSNASLLGDAVTYTATVSSGSGTPTGQVQFKDGGDKLGAPIALAAGAASVTVPLSPAGTHTITATYSGDPAFTPGTSPPLTHTVVTAGIEVDDGASVAEGQGGATLLQFKVRARLGIGAVSTVFTVSYTTSDGTAVAGTDYVSRTGSITFQADQTGSILIPVLGNQTAGPDKTLSVHLTLDSCWPVSCSPGTAILKSEAVGTIIDDDPAGAAIPVSQYRLYSPITLEHHYTTDANEYAVLGTQLWSQEGIAYTTFKNPGSSGGVFAVPVYRLYHPGIRQHHWTTDANEATVLSGVGWSYEGISGYILPSQASGTVPLYRLALASPPLHLWTTDANEKTVLSTQRGWVFEGIVGYVIP